MGVERVGSPDPAHGPGQGGPERHVISVVVTTYNRAEALRAVLWALRDQRDTAFEVIVADDGSGPDTREMIARMGLSLPYRLEHIWQEDRGFRASVVRNRAIVAAGGPYIVFLDGDCVPLPSFVERHRSMAERGHFASGNRILLQEDLTRVVLEERAAVQRWAMRDWVRARLRGGVNRLLPFVRLPDLGLRKLSARRWQGVQSCNLGVWRADLLRVNGFDERYTGWGREDSDLAVRLIRAGVRRKDLRFAVPVLHLWHREFDRSRLTANDELLGRVLESDTTVAPRGIDRHL